MGNYDRDIQEAVAGVSAPALNPEQITFKNGVILKKKDFSILTIQRIISKFKYPDIPEFYDEDRKRGIKNPDHPEYLRMKEEVDTARGMAVLDAIITFGTEVHFIPDTVQKVEDIDWIEKCELLEIPILKDNRAARYLAWVRNVAVSDNEDLIQLMGMVQASAGVPGEPVGAAIDSFQRHS